MYPTFVLDSIYETCLIFTRFICNGKDEEIKGAGMSLLGLSVTLALFTLQPT